MKMVMYKNVRAFIVLLPLFLAACAPKIALNIDQTALIPQENAVQYLQSYDWAPSRWAADIKKRCGSFTDTTFSGYPYEKLTVTFVSANLQGWIETDDGKIVCDFKIQSKPSFSASESDLEKATRFTQAFISLGGKYKYSGY